MMKKIIKNFFIFLCLLIVLEIIQLFFFDKKVENNNLHENLKTEKFYSAEVIEILEQRINELGDGVNVEQQKLELKILDKERLGEKIIVNGIGDFDVLKKNFYVKGDKVLLLESLTDDGSVNYYITDYIRTDGLKYLFIIFMLLIILIGSFKGLRALFSLVITFFVIIKFIIPQILIGANPIIVTLIGSLLILGVIIYLTEGVNTSSHISFISILFSLLITIIISNFFVNLTKLSGFNSEEMSYLVELGVFTINFKGLLLASIIIGTLGVLDDVVISQVTAVKEILEADNKQSKKELFKKSFNIGLSHLSSMTNTLFLAYAGASMSLLILFASGESAFSSWQQIINNEVIATEIVRTFSGGIGLILAVPISTAIAVWKFKN